MTSDTQVQVQAHEAVFAMDFTTRAKVEAEKGSLESITHSFLQSAMQEPDELPATGDTTSQCSETTWNPGSRLNVISSPISILLEELLIMIFYDVITSESSSYQYQHQRAAGGWQLSPPRNLASVSRTWRNIVFACPMLWRRVHLTPRQSIHALKEQLRYSLPLSIHLTVHQWPFRNPFPKSGALSIVALTAQLQSILSPLDYEGTIFAPASQRVESITINATESSTFMNFVLQTWTGRGSRFPTLRHVTMDGNTCATWSRACFFDGKNAPQLERLELNNVVIAHDVHRLPWGTGLNLTTLVWTAPTLKRGSLVLSASCFHHVIISFPNLIKLELHGNVVGLQFATLENLEGSGITPLPHIRDLRVSGRVFGNATAAFALFYILPSLRYLAVRGRACSGPFGLRTVSFALQALTCLPRLFDWPIVLPNLEDLELECVDGPACQEWQAWCAGEVELWRQWRETVANAGERSNIVRVRMRLVGDGSPRSDDEGGIDDE